MSHFHSTQAFQETSVGCVTHRLLSPDQICQKLTVSGSQVARDSQSASTSYIQRDISNKCASEEERDSSGPMSPVGSAVFVKL